jgi:hypothetical protein
MSDRYGALLVRINDKLEAMPKYAREFVQRFRRHVEMVGRSGPTGCADVELERFIDATLGLLQAQWDAVLANTKPAQNANADMGSGH